MLDGIEEASTVTRDVSGTLTLGTMGIQGWMIEDILEKFRALHPAANRASRWFRAGARARVRPYDRRRRLFVSGTGNATLLSTS